MLGLTVWGCIYLCPNKKPVKAEVKVGCDSRSASLLFAPDENQILVVEHCVKPAKGRAGKHYPLAVLVPIVCPACILARDDGLDRPVPRSNSHYIPFANRLTRAIGWFTLHANDASSVTRRPGGYDCNRGAHARFAARHAEPFCVYAPIHCLRMTFQSEAHVDSMGMSS